MSSSGWSRTRRSSGVESCVRFVTSESALCFTPFYFVRGKGLWWVEITDYHFLVAVHGLENFPFEVMKFSPHRFVASASSPLYGELALGWRVKGKTRLAYLKDEEDNLITAPRASDLP